MALDFGLQFPLLCDKEDDSLKTYLGQDCFNEFQSADILSPTFAGDDLVDHLVRQLETQSNETGIELEVQQSGHFDNERNIDQLAGNNGLLSMTDQEGFLRLLDELDVDIGDASLNGDNPSSDNSAVDTWDGPAMTFVDEHDYARGAKHPRVSLSASYSSMDEGCLSGSESHSSSSYERQITSNSSSSSIAFDYAVPQAAALDAEMIFDKSGAGSQSAYKQRRPNGALPNPKSGKPVNASSTLKRKYPPLVLSEEERQLCEKEHIYLPDSYPLTKEEERKLRGIRRKIRNKASAQLSRKKKQEYVEALEHRATHCLEENEALKRHVKMLTGQNSKLQAQLRKLQAALANNGRRSAQTGTCLAVLLLSFALLIAPEYSPFGKRNVKNQYDAASNVDDVTSVMTPGNTRTLLQWQGLRANVDSIRDEDNLSLSRSNRYFYDNESTEFMSEPISTKKRKPYLAPLDAAPGYGDHELDGPYAKGMKFADDIPDKIRIDLDVYKTPGIVAVSNESRGGHNRQPYEIVGNQFRTEDM